MKHHYIVQHEVIFCSSKICDWSLNSSPDHLGSHQRNNVKVSMELDVLKRPIFRSTLSIVIIQQVLGVRKAKVVLLLQKSRDHPREMSFQSLFLFRPNIFVFKRREGKKRGEGKTWRKGTQICPFGHIIQRSAHPLLGAWSLFLVNVQFTSSDEPKSLKITFSHKSYHRSVTVKVTMDIGHLTWDNVVNHDVNNPLLWKYHWTHAFWQRKSILVVHV